MCESVPLNSAAMVFLAASISSKTTDHKVKCLTNLIKLSL